MIIAYVSVCEHMDISDYFENIYQIINDVQIG